MLLKSTSAGNIATSISSGLKTNKGDESGLKTFLNSIAKETKPSDLAKGFGLAGFTKEETLAAVKNSNFKDSLSDVVEEFGNFNMATTGIKGKFNTMKDGADKLGDSLSNKLGKGLDTVKTLASGLLAAHPIAVVVGGLAAAIAVVTAATVGIKKWNDAQNVKSATKSYNEWSDRDDNLTSQIESYKQLKEQLDSGVLSAQEEYDIRSQILDIQSQIADTYGSQADGIDLVNGGLTEQVNLLKQIRQEDANKYLNDNDKKIGKTIDNMEDKKSYSLGTMVAGTKENKYVTDIIKNLNSKYGKELFTKEFDGTKNTESFKITADASEAYDALNDFMNYMKDAEKDTSSDDGMHTSWFTSMYKNASKQLEDVNETIDDNSKLYKTAKMNQLIADESLYSDNGMDKTADEWYEAYQDAISDYSKAVASGDDEMAAAAEKSFNTLQSSIGNLLTNNKDFAKYKSVFDEITESAKTDSIASSEFVRGLKGLGDTGYEKRLNNLGQTIKGLNLDEEKFFNILKSGKDSNIKDVLNSVISMAKSAGYITGTSSSEIQPLIDLLGELGYMSVDAASHIDTTALSAEQLATKVETAQTALSNINSVISASNSDSGLLADNITALEESFGGLDSYNAESLLSNTADGVKLNTTALKGLIEQQHKVDSDDLEARIKGQNEELQKQKDILNDVTQSEDNKQNAKEQIDSITDAIERMKQAQSQLYASYKQQMELTSDYQAVLDAESTPNAGARYDNMKSKVKTAKEAFDKGEIGTDDFKTVARYLSPNGFEDPDNFIENYQKAKRYLTDDSSGVINFLQDLQSKGLATMTTLADGTHEWTTSFDDAAEASKQAGMGYEFFMDMFGKAEDYGAFNTFISSAEEGELKVQDLSKQLAEAKTRMAELQSQGADESSLQGQQKVIDELEAKLGKQQGVLDDYYGSYKQKQAQQLEDAKEQLDLMSDQIKNESNQNVKDFLVANFKQLAKEYGLDYNYDENSGNISVDNDSYKDQMSQYGNTWVNPASVEDMGYKEGTQEAKDYQAAVDSLTAAHEKNDAATEESFKTLSQYNAEELKGIELDNNKYDSDDTGLRKAEDALQMLSDTYGLTKDQLLEGLEGLGQLKPEIDDSDMEKAKSDAEETKNVYDNLDGSTSIIDVDFSNEDDLNKFVTECQNIPKGVDTTITATVSGEKEFTTFEEGLKEIPEDRPVTISCQFDNVEAANEAQKLVNQINDGRSEENKITLHTEIAPEDKETSVKVKPDPEELDVKAKDTTVKVTADPEKLTVEIEGKPKGKSLLDGLDQGKSDKTLSITEDVQTKGDVDKATELENAPDNKVKGMSFEITTSTPSSGVEALIDMFGGGQEGQDTLTKTIDIVTKGDMIETNEILTNLSSTPIEVLVSMVQKGMSLEDIIRQANGEEVEIPVEYEDPDAIDTSNLDPVDLKAHISSVETDTAAPPVMDATANITNTQGADGQQVNVDATANITDTQGADGQQVNIDATANITDTTGAENQSVNVDANTSGTEDVDKLKSSVDSVKSKEVKTEAKVNGEPQVRSLKSAIDALTDKTVTVTAVTNGANTVTALGSAINALHDKTVTITTNHVNNGSSGTSRPKASGSMTSIAHADGTAYNMLNLKPLSSAHAGGNVALGQNETALTNEVGTESIVRDGVWSLLPGGPHMENLKKGDIIFSASQTEDLLKYGKTNSHARAYANGTLAVSPAHVGGPSTTGYSGLNDKYLKKSSSSSSNKKSSGSSSSKSSSKSSGKSKSSSSSKDSEQDVDYIEIKFKRLERVISNFGKIASDTFRSLGNRLDHLTKIAGNKKYDSELELLKSEKNTATKAVSYYLKKANGVKLDAATKKKIREGAIDYRTYSSKNDKKYKNIKKYQTFYEKSLDARDKQLEIEENIAKLFSDRFDMISTDFDNDKALIEHRTNTANNNIDYLEEKGYLGSKANYSAIASATQDEINKSTAKIEALKAERAYALSNPYSGIVKDSEQDKEFQKAIQEEIENRQELNTQLAEANNNMRQVDWDRFDYIQERISDISSEADFMIDLMAQRKDELYQDRGHTDKVENANVAGKFTDKGTAVMGLHGQNYNTYMAQANQYAEEIKKLNAEIAKDPNNTKLIDRRKELLEAQRDNIKSAEDEKQAMADLIEDGINRQIDALGTLIDEYEDSIDSAKDLYDYQKKVKDQTEEISKIQKQLNAYAGDDSEESKANIQKLKEDLKDAQEDLQDTQYDRYISEQKKLLSDLSDKYKETLNARLDNIDALVADMITKSNENKESINQTLQTEADKVGYTISDAMKDIWGTTNNVLGTTDNKGSILGQVTSVNEVLNAINAKVQSMQTNSDKQSTQVNEGAKTDTALPAKKENTGSNNSNNSNNSNQPAKKNNGKKQGNGKVEVGDHVTFASGSYTADSSGGGASGTSNRGKKVYVTKIQKGAKKPYHISTGKKFGSGDLGWVSKSQLKGYKTGGLVDYTGLAQLDGTPNKPELVLNSVDTENFLKLRDALRDGFDFTPNMNTPMFTNTAFDGIASQIGRIASVSSKETTIGNVINQVTIQIDHVENYEDFMNQMTKDDKFEKFIQSMTTDRLAGGSKLAKNKYKW